MLPVRDVPVAGMESAFFSLQESSEYNMKTFMHNSQLIFFVQCSGAFYQVDIRDKYI